MILIKANHAVADGLQILNTNYIAIQPYLFVYTVVRSDAQNSPNKGLYTLTSFCLIKYD